jgi:glycosyltransferase involved in cell wall biosynthesis
MKHDSIASGTGRRLQVDRFALDGRDYRCSHILHDVIPPNLGVESPLVSVIVTNYNYGRYIGQCLDSIVQQTYPSFECIVVDDASTDDSIERVEAYLREHAGNRRLRLLRHQHNQGQMAAFSTGLREASGVFVTFVDADDLLLPDFLDTHAGVHCNFPPVALTCSSQYVIAENGALIAAYDTAAAAYGRLMSELPQNIWHEFWFGTTTSAMMFRRSALDLIFPTQHDGYRICADNYLSKFATLLGSCILIPSRHGLYRRHGGNNFADLPVVGRHIRIGRDDTSSLHARTTDEIRMHLLRRGEDFRALMSKNQYLQLLGRVTPPSALRGDIMREAVAAGALSRRDRRRLVRTVISNMFRKHKHLGHIREVFDAPAKVKG